MSATPRLIHEEPKWFPARFEGRCGECMEPIEIGEIIGYNENGSVVRNDCCGTDRTITTPPCPKCFQIPSVNGVCGCDA